ncbi:hypothetical protein GE107_00750 [Cohnella sp. CFH 77786]|uniref:hypothetical protein n=1 Tax=Cohnella sp. CFH 77786 TaxID=2662265 RepID=UPI001C60BB1C|nr:hypothetical protein [Cohnella sp. CFH 77786]MBW5444594.1 hypothetical protein [Cohnella sp. CFH 77786]
MGMNIGPMLRAMLGETVPADAKALELRIGQIVRGVLMEMLDNGEALMNINGVAVRAKLETELQVGRGTLLQVQPGGSGGTVLLKPLAEPSEAIPDDGLKNVLKSFGLPDQKWAYELLRGLKRDGYAINRDTGAYFLNAASLKPAAADPASWMAAADVAFRRGLTSSEETISALRQTLFGQPLHAELAGFASALREWTGTDGAKSSPVSDLAGRLQTLLAEGEKLLAQGENQLLGGGSRTGSREPASSGITRTPGMPIDGSAGEPAQKVEAESHGQSASRQVPSIPSGAAAPGGSGLLGQPAPASAAQSVSSSAAPDPHAFPSASGRPTTTDPEETIVRSPLRHNGISDSGNIQPNAKEVMAREPSAAPRGATSRDESGWIGRFLQWLGTGHEHRLQNAADFRLQADLSAMASGTLPSGDERPAADNPRSSAETLKSALLTLASHEEAPPALRDAAQSLVNQITGQQLLLSSERQPANPYSMMTLFLPMKGQDGNTTATIHVQTRRGRKGEWDTDNCRLLFDLRMRHLGDTVVDVQVVDRIVSVKLMNDYPGMAELVEHAKDEVGIALRDAGFQLLSMTAQPLPQLREPSAPDSSERRDKPEGAAAAAFAAKPYKGVDFRV